MVHGRTLVAVVSAGRIVTGALMLAVPHRASAAWLGADGLSGAILVGSRMLGARELALGAGTLLAWRRGDSVSPWMTIGALTDATDFVAVGMADSTVSRVRRRRTMMVATAAAGMQLALSRIAR